MARSILWTSAAHPLKDAHQLGDYEALIVEPTWENLVGLRGPAPGYEQSIDLNELRLINAGLERRTPELLGLLHSGGILAVKVQAPSVLKWSNSVGTRISEVNTEAWLINAIPKMGGSWNQISRIGSGNTIVVREPGHPLENVIQNASGYAALLNNTVLQDNETILLATTRTGVPIAAEIPVSRGVVFLLPSGVDHAALTSALDQLLDDRARYRGAWVLPQEKELLDQVRGVRAALQAQVRKLEAEIDELADIRSAVMKDVHVERAIAYYENGVSPTRDIKHAMQDLYKLVEMLEARLGGSEDALALALALPKARFKHIKKLANQKDLDFRHATSGQPVGADVADVEQARKDARELVQKFIELRSLDEMNRRARSTS